eukprot:754588-Hanusia_phi.AAC.1
MQRRGGGEAGGREGAGRRGAGSTMLRGRGRGGSGGRDVRYWFVSKGRATWRCPGGGEVTKKIGWGRSLSTRWVVDITTPVQKTVKQDGPGDQMQ